MAYRGNQNRSRNFGGNNYGGSPMGPNRMGNMMSPWDNQNVGGNFGAGNMRQGGQGMNAQAINLANNLLNNLFRNQTPPSLLDLPRGAGGMGNRNQRGGPMVNRGGPVGNRMNNRRPQGGFQNRGGAPGGPKSAQKQGAGGIRKQNAFDRAKKLLAKNANSKKKDSAPGDKKNESKESPYASVPNDMFYCHLCKKHMWDANSFENHIKGRTHLMMREGIEESYRLKANMIRQEAKIAEQLKSIEFDRLKRMGKSKSNRAVDYCTMCDLNFHGNISAHRKTDGHLQLKKFLHPRCAECSNEFPTRIDYDSHLLSADHLKKAAEKNTKVGERKRNTLQILTEEEELKDVRPPQKRKKKAAAAKKTEGDGEVKKEGEEGAEGEEDGDADESEVKKEGGEEGADETKEGEELNDTQEEEEIAPPVDPEDCILDFAEGDEIPGDVDARLPKYNWTRPVGYGLINKLECFECSLCGKFFDTETTVEVHSRTVSHHRNFLKFINEKSSDTKIAQKRAAAALEESERKKRKLEEAEAAAAGAEVKAENGGEEGADGELYDPSEATGDDEDVEMGENGEEAEEGGEDGNNEAMETHEEEEEAEPEPEPEPEPVKEEPKPEPVKTPAKPTPAATPESTPAKKATPARGGAVKGTPRGRGSRGRSNRY